MYLKLIVIFPIVISITYGLLKDYGVDSFMTMDQSCGKE